ncbi:MAG TPA: single-stranded-DNA-specific exonuclease RecJ [Aquaticitalea sp.]|nr:single-stranded-DNA-specific exonuclease RecJ [Aquaticitalea sp.]
MRWTLKPSPDSQKVQKLSELLNVDHTIASLLIQRGIETFDDSKRFFRPSLNDLHDPFLMKDMDKAVDRVEKAFSANENILVFGDYDVDGTSSVALMASYLKTRTETVATYIPDRYEEGYGVSYQGIDFAHDNGFTLIIALDCGVKAVEKIAYAKEKGIDFIVCDHHRPGSELPNAIAVLDPKREDCQYPYDELCGCGIGFKLVQALAIREGKAAEQLVEYLDLVATAIAADIVPITGENRTLTYFGLKIINQNPRAGIKALLAQTKKKDLNTSDVVFIIAPRINAAGRIKHGNHAVALLMETDFDKASDYAKDIEQFNLDRKEADQQITLEALEQIEDSNEQERFTTVVYSGSWHKGVIGIVASRLTETYYRPTLVFTKSGNKLAASARSVSGFDVYNALEACSEHLEQFGGHKYAAGLTLKEENYEVFKQAFEDEVSRTIDTSLLTPEIKIDAKIELSDITPKFFRILKQFEPFGPGNMTPIFVADNLKDSGFGKCVGENDKHLRLNIGQHDSQTFAAIGFNLGTKYHLAKSPRAFKAVFTIDENVWNDKVSLQLRLRDIEG